MTENHPIIFVGAGPGDPELITVKGQKALGRADLVLYAGSLVSPAVLGWTNPNAELVDTAKLNLEDICARLMAGRARRQSGGPGPLRRPRLVRRHPGANGILERENIPCQVIPGVSAAFRRGRGPGTGTHPAGGDPNGHPHPGGGAHPGAGGRKKPSTIWPGMGPPWSSISASNSLTPWWPNSFRLTVRRDPGGGGLPGELAATSS